MRVAPLPGRPRGSCGAARGAEDGKRAAADRHGFSCRFNDLSRGPWWKVTYTHFNRTLITELSTTVRQRRRSVRFHTDTLRTFTTIINATVVLFLLSHYSRPGWCVITVICIEYGLNGH